MPARPVCVFILLLLLHAHGRDAPVVDCEERHREHPGRGEVVVDQLVGVPEEEGPTRGRLRGIDLIEGLRLKGLELRV